MVCRDEEEEPAILQFGDTIIRNRIPYFMQFCMANVILQYTREDKKWQINNKRLFLEHSLEKYQHWNVDRQITNW